ncbi:Helix-turn-helix domain protein [Pelotomaculum schinkii]|uniref:Helix-turn-helix domain protein n=1 Tax=Pelotomaculum schinkii TaxID=78350 RepID=A0A4Y7RAZ2_9FIRM|nr:helix-turn-helix domain-containing protein [Pelotomaculum schinkii]TEB05861.1 Helix-turn-helix domain protein [Pelotomaculum schinkii]
MPKQNYTAESLPDILTAQHISDYLGISRRRVYELFQLKPDFGGIPNFEIGFSKRVDKQDFLQWIEAKKKEKAEK